MSSLIDAFALLPAQLRTIFDLDAAAMRLAIRKLHADVEAALDKAADKCNEPAPGETYEALLVERNTLRTTLANATGGLDSLRAEYAECLKELFATRKERDAARGEAQHYMAELNECRAALHRERMELEQLTSFRDACSKECDGLRVELDRSLNQLRVAFDENDKLRARIAALTDHKSPGYARQLPPAEQIGLAMRVLHSAPGKLCRLECKAELDGVVDWLRSFGPTASVTASPWEHGREVTVSRGDGKPFEAVSPPTMAEPAPLTPTGELEALQKQVARLESRLGCYVRHDDRRITSLEERVFDELGERVRKLESVAHAPQPVASADDVELLWQFLDDVAATPSSSLSHTRSAQRALDARAERKR